MLAELPLAALDPRGGWREGYPLPPSLAAAPSAWARAAPIVWQAMDHLGQLSASSAFAIALEPQVVQGAVLSLGLAAPSVLGPGLPAGGGAALAIGAPGTLAAYWVSVQNPCAARPLAASLAGEASWTQDPAAAAYWAAVEAALPPGGGGGVGGAPGGSGGPSRL